MTIAFVFYGYVDNDSVVNVAAFNRLLNLTKLFKQNEFDCEIFALSKNSNSSMFIDNIQVNRIHKGGRDLSLFRVGKLFAERIGTRSDILAVAYVSAFTRVIIPIRKMFKKQNKNLKEIVIANDKYEKGAVDLITWLDSKLAWENLYKSIDNVISISSSFEDFFSESKNVVVIPSIFSENAFEEKERDDYINEYHPLNISEKIVFSYAGNLKFTGKTLAQKDLVANFHFATSLLPKYMRNKICLKIYGTEKKDYIESLHRIFPEFDIDHGCDIAFCGFMPHKKLHKEIMKSHFTILFRPDMDYANFGFPTKFAESMLLGVPVFANLTSDLGLYLHDHVEGMLASSENPIHIATGIRRIFDLSADEYESMRQNARSQAKRSFVASNYLSSIYRFMANLC